jgi:hypothetical protein
MLEKAMKEGSVIATQKAATEVWAQTTPHNAIEQINTILVLSLRAPC